MNGSNRFLPFSFEDIDSNDDFSKLVEGDNYALEQGSMIEGRIINRSKDNYIIDVGLKNEGIVSVSEFYPNYPDIGDTVSLSVKRLENRAGKIILSREEAVKKDTWKLLEKSYEDKTVIIGKIVEKVKGGYAVNTGGVITFLPGSQVNIKPVKDISDLMGKDLEFHVLKIDNRLGNIVVSRKSVLEKEISADKESIFSSLSEGKILKGVVKNITDYGAFVDMGMVDGLLHITDISWSRINHPSELLNIGDEIDVVIIKIDNKAKRLSLGMKQINDKPWQKVKEAYKVGEIGEGLITNITEYGIFVGLGNTGISGLVISSEIEWGKITMSACSGTYTIGATVKFIITEIDDVNCRVGLSMKRCTASPWDGFVNKYKEGSVIDAVIKKVVDFGLIVDIHDNEYDLTGLVHINDISWNSSEAYEAIKKFKKGDVISCKLINVDVEKEKISLSIKHLSNNAYQVIFDKYNQGDVVTCIILDVKKSGIEVSFEGIKTFINKSELSMDKFNSNAFHVGDKVDAKISVLDGKTRRIDLSIRLLEIEHRKDVKKKYGSLTSGAMLGNIIGDAIPPSDIAPDKTKDKK